jgi:hypothetical protein
MLELRHVSKRFSGIVAVDDVSFLARAVRSYLECEISLLTICITAKAWATA